MIESIEVSAPNRKRLPGAIVYGIVFGVLVAFGPLLVIKHRDPYALLHDQPSQRLIFYIVDAIGSALAFGAIYARHTSVFHPEANITQKILAWLDENSAALLLTLSLFLYKACAALCFKLAILPLPLSPHALRWCYNFAFIIGAVACLGLARQFLDGSLVNLVLSRPISSSGKKLLSLLVWSLFYLIAIPLLFNTYFPLLALPGAFICLNWQLRHLTGATRGGVAEEEVKS